MGPGCREVRAWVTHSGAGHRRLLRVALVTVMTVTVNPLCSLKWSGDSAGLGLDVVQP